MVTKKPKGLGMGLEALLGPKVKERPVDETPSTTASGTPSSLPLTDLVAGVYQPRTHMDEGALYELAESIKVGIWESLKRRTLYSSSSFVTSAC